MIKRSLASKFLVGKCLATNKINVQLKGDLSRIDGLSFDPISA